MMQIDITKQLYGAKGTMQLRINLQIASGEFVALAGESGSGKTTLLRILAGLESAQGHISMDQKIWLDAKSTLPPQKRQIGFLFQEYALFENMNIEKNLLFVNNDKQLAHQLLELTHLSELKQRYPRQLSGGQKQRVALCRAMMNRPKLLLLDEPLSALDPTMRSNLQQEILTLHKTFGTTTIMVSHDPSEIYRLAQRVILLEQGKIIQEGSPKSILLQHNHTNQFSLEGELLEILQVPPLYIAIVSIGQQLIKLSITETQAKQLTIGQRVTVNTNAFAPTLNGK